jgi:hypothetical protein
MRLNGAAAVYVGYGRVMLQLTGSVWVGGRMLSCKLAWVEQCMVPAVE